MINVEVKLNQVEQKMVDGLPEALRVQVTESILAAKREAMEAIVTNRNQFSISINDGGTIVIRGLGNRYPTGLRHDQLEILLSHVPELTKAVADAKAYIANNEAKVKAFEETRAKKRAEQARKMKLGEAQLKLVAN
jgi:hypothetical protein